MWDNLSSCLLWRLSNHRDALSTWILHEPFMWAVATGEDWATYYLIASALNNLPASNDFDDNFVAQATVGVLSLKIPTDLNLTETQYSKTIKCKRWATISSSEIAISPLRFVEDTRRHVISSGSSNRHTIGLVIPGPDNHTPPRP